jgi:hypothetical protein
MTLCSRGIYPTIVLPPHAASAQTSSFKSNISGFIEETCRYGNLNFLIRDNSWQHCEDDCPKILEVQNFKHCAAERAEWNNGNITDT